MRWTACAVLLLAPLAASPLAASPLAASPLAASPLAASPLAASPLAASPLAASPLAASPGITAGRALNVASGALTLNGAGANSIAPLFEQVFYDYHRSHPSVTVNYQPAGSSVGVSDIQQRTVDFGDSEIPMSYKELAKAHGTVLQLPVDLGGIAVSYNVPGAPKGLKLNGAVLAGIFTGTITNWASPAIAKVSGVNNLPNLRIVPVHRADSSGPGWDLDEYLIKTSPEWFFKIGTSQPSKSWPMASIGVGEQLNSGVASYIAQTPGAIGYLEYGYALRAGFTNAALQNAAGRFVAPSESSIAAAGAHADRLAWNQFDIIFQPGNGTYPLANFSWTLIYRDQSSAAKAAALRALFTYVVTTGQRAAARLGYVPLPANAVALAKTALSQLRS
jgi:phosphate transport system substrate-binding protein